MDMYLHSKKPKWKKFLKSAILWMIEILFVILAAYLIIEYALEKTTMTGNSMSGALEDGDKIIINKLAYWKKNPERYDVIVFKQSNSEHKYYNIKRVIGIPGDTIEIADGYIYINGEKLEEEIETEPMQLSGLAQKPILLQENEYFVLGDNRNQSEDSRFANIGIVVKNDIIGKAWLRLSPFSVIDRLNKK